jgi:hypothetical protein
MIRRIVLALLLALPLPAAAQLLGDARVGFTADRTVVVNDRTFQGRVWSMPGKQRHEQDIEGIPQVILLRGDGRGWLVLPGMKSYVEFGYAPVVAELGDPAAIGPKVGEETVGGIRTSKHRIEHTARDGTFIEGWLWRSAEGIVMKLEGTATAKRGGGKPLQIRMSLANVRTGTQEAGLFDLPQGLVKLPSGALQPLLGNLGGGGRG